MISIVTDTELFFANLQKSRLATESYWQPAVAAPALPKVGEGGLGGLWRTVGPQHQCFLLRTTLVLSHLWPSVHPDRPVRLWISADHFPFKIHSLSGFNWSSCLRSWEVIIIPFYLQPCDIHAGPAEDMDTVYFRSGNSNLKK